YTYTNVFDRITV
ncbi:N-acetylglucosaminylphosphatidylinositol deacetylase, partial [Toxoplasma gondii VAND]